MRSRSPWTVLAVLALAQFMDVLDVTIVNVALPGIQRDLHVAGNDLQWVISAYTLFYGGFLLLGGRAADLLGRRRTFLVGLAVFGVSSLAAGLAPTPGVLIALRASQGLGGALMSPAALSLLSVTFPAGRDRNVALGVWGGLAGLGGTLGVVFGGALVDALSWRWVFLVNVPVVAGLLVVTPLLIASARPERVGRRAFDLPGALLGTGGLLTLVLGVIRAEPAGWGSGQVLALLATGVALLTAFIRVEAASPDPLIPLRVFRSRGLGLGSGTLALNGAGFLAMFFLTAVFLQQVRGLSALATGVDFLPMGGAAIAGALVASNLVTRVGTRPVQLTGTVLSAAGLLLLSRVTADGGYARQLLPGLLVFGAGIVAVGVPTQIAALADVRSEDSGASAGVINAAYQVGGALGLAVISTLSTGAAHAATASGARPQDALVAGYHRGLLLAAAFALVNVVLAGSTPRVRPTPEMVAAAAVG